MARLVVLHHMAVAQLGFKCHTIAVPKSNLMQLIEFGTAVARHLKRTCLSYEIPRSVTSMYAHTPVRTAKIWTKSTFYFLKAFVSLNRND